ncbi:MAG: glycosyltransferase family 4 protein [Ignavibacteria bacterium]
MKVIYLSSESYIDHSYTIVEELQKHVDLNVFLQAKERTEEIDSWCNKFNAEFYPRKRFRNPLSIFKEIIFLRKIRDMKPDVIWFNTMTVYQLLLVPRMFKKYLVMMHDVEEHPESRDKHGKLTVKLTLMLAKKHITTASKTQAGIFKRRFGFAPKVFQLPVINYYSGQEHDIIPAAEPGRVRFFFFGSVEAYKGIELLLDAAEILEKRGLEFGLNVYGKLKYSREEIRTRILGLKNAELHDEFINYRKVRSIYSQNDILVLPYTQVTQCGPLLIGFSEGVPAICSDLPGFREYITDGEDGLLFENTAESLADKMELVIKRKVSLEKLKKGIEEIAMKSFSMENLLEEYIRNFESVL